MAKVLLIVEGANLEPRFFSRMSEVFGLELEIVPLCANIYRIYQKLEEYGFDYDVRVALRELVDDEESLRKLADVYAYTYLVFDCDAHHSGVMKRGEEPKDIAVVVEENYDRLALMLKYFTDETDPERGRLYVNYPMMESYRDCDTFFEESYRDRVVRYECLSQYKQIVGRRRMANRRIEGLCREAFESMTRMSLFKLSFILEGTWAMTEKLCSGEHVSQERLLNAQRAKLQERVMFVINTSLFISLDYNRG